MCFSQPLANRSLGRDVLGDVPAANPMRSAGSEVLPFSLETGIGTVDVHTHLRRD